MRGTHLPWRGMSPDFREKDEIESFSWDTNDPQLLHGDEIRETK